VALLGLWFEWSYPRVILVGFVISLSSTAVVIKLLQDSGMLNSRLGQGVLSILLAQDLAIIPMLIILGLLGEGQVEGVQLVKQGVGAIVAIAAIAALGFIVSRDSIHLPLSKWLKEDRELQLFTALAICFGLALITAWLELSTALGAFMAGMIIGAAKETDWVHHTLESFKVLFVALFFVSIGMLLDIHFLGANWPITTALVATALLTNTFINAFILRLAKFKLKDSLYAGMLLSQIGEFSFVLAAVGLHSSLISDYGYQLSISVIALSLLVSPVWISLGKTLLKWQGEPDH
jgi:CPA2 family monovalent cation:H+ antiporter-2